MSFLDLGSQQGRKPVIAVEIVLDYCSLLNGELPCTATSTAGKECYNTYHTCQDRSNFNKTTKTYRFIENISELPAGVEAIPCLESIDLAPTKIIPNSIGERASVKIKLHDLAHHDRNIDPYVSNRDYDPISQGTFFGKLFARNPFYLNRELRIKTGYIDPVNGFDKTFNNDFETRRYFIDKVEGPDTKGFITITAKDVLKFTNDGQAPKPSDGLLVSNLSSAATTLDLSPGYSTLYPTSGYIRINGEVIAYSGKSGDQFTGLSRGQNGTTADSHEAGDSVQVCLHYQNEKPSNILEDILTNYSNVDSQFIPSADWLNENDSKILSNTLTALITEPTDTKQLLEEVLKSSLSYIWWDEVDQEIKFKVNFPITTRDAIATLNDDNFLENSVKIQDLERKRITDVIVYYNQIDATEDNKKTNFKNVIVSIDPDAKSDNQYGTERTLEIVSRWINGNGPAIEISGRQLNIYKTTPKRISFVADAKDIINTGDVLQVRTRLLQNSAGKNQDTLFLITKREPNKIGSNYKYEGEKIGNVTRAFYIAPNDTPSFDQATDEQRNKYGFISDNNGQMSDGSESYKII